MDSGDVSMSRKIATLIGAGIIGGGGGLPTYTLAPSGLADGALPSPWVGAAFAVSSGAIKNTPTEGGDIINNGAFAADTDWTKGTGWTIGSGVATKAAGTASQLLNTAGGRPLQKWYRTTLDATVTAGFFTPAYVNNYGANIASTGAHDSDGLAVTTPSFIYSAATAATAGTVDNITCKPLTFNTLIASVNAGYIAAIVKAALTKGDGRCGGVVANLDSQSSPANYIIASVIVNGVTTSLIVYKVVGGTYTGIASGTITYSAGAYVELRTRRNGANLLVQAYYNGTAVSTEQTVSDAGIVSNTLHGIFSTNNANSIGVVSVAPNP